MYVDSLIQIKALVGPKSRCMYSVPMAWIMGMPECQNARMSLVRKYIMGNVI